MAHTRGAEQIKLKVFISCSRRDEDFARKLLACLEQAGFEPYLDKHDIAPDEDWEVRAARLIEAADTVVFVISPDAVASERCAWEVEHRIDLKKRLLPTIYRGVAEAQIPPGLKQLNHIFFDHSNFEASLKSLANTLRADIRVNKHPQMGEVPLRWDARDRAERHVGAMIAAAARQNAPRRDKAAPRNWRRSLAVGAGLAALLVFGGVVWWHQGALKDLLP